MTSKVDETVASLLEDIADSLGRLAGKGVRPILRHNAVLTDHGFALPDEAGSEWSVRMKITDLHLVPVGDPDDD